MPRLRALLIAGFAALCAFFALASLATAAVSAAAIPAPGASSRLGAPLSDVFEASDPLSIAAIVLAQQSTVTCTLTTTTTDGLGFDNSTFATAATVANYSNLALAPGPPGPVPAANDYFKLNALQGLHYTVEAKPNQISNYILGIIVYNSSFTPLITDTNTLDGSGAKVTLIAPSNGLFYFRVFQIDGTSCTGGTYSLVASEATPTPTPTGSPTTTRTSTTTPAPGTPIPGADRFEPNWTFEIASLIAPNQKEANLNFVPAPGASLSDPDNDYYRFWVKPGELYTCETLDLSGFTDTNVILYDNNRNGLGGNDDIDRASGNKASRVRYYATYEGWLYVLVGNVYPIDDPGRDAAKFTYSLLCSTGPGPTSTPTNTRVPVTPPTAVPTNTPTPSLTPTSSPTPTPTPPFIQVRQLPTVTPQGQPAPKVIPISLQVYYDLNNSNAPDPGEGVVGISARVVDVTTGQELAHSFTDEFGFANLTVSAPGVVRLTVPYLGKSFIIQPSGSSVLLRIAPYGLPGTIP